MVTKWRAMKISPDFGSAAAREFLLRKVCKRSSRQPLQSSEERFQLARLLDGGSIQRRHFGVELEVDRLVVNLEGAFEVGPVAFGRIPVTGALLVAALHHPLEHRSLAEVVELSDLPFKGFKTLCVPSDARCQSVG